jgi:hypothetical protein
MISEIIRKAGPVNNSENQILRETPDPQELDQEYAIRNSLRGNSASSLVLDLNNYGRLLTERDIDIDNLRRVGVPFVGNLAGEIDVDIVPQNIDMFRFFLGGFYSLNKTSGEIEHADFSVRQTAVKISFDKKIFQFGDQYLQRIFFEDSLISDEGGVILRILDRIKFKDKFARLFSPEFIVKDRLIEDKSFFAFFPQEATQDTLYQNLISADSVYNFFDSSLNVITRIVQEGKFSESGLLSFYDWGDFYSGEEPKSEGSKKRLLFGNRIAPEQIKGNPTSYYQGLLDIPKSALKLESNQEYRKYVNLQENTLPSQETKHMFPIYNEFRISLTPRGPLGRILEETNISLTLLNHLIQKDIAEDIAERTVFRTDISLGESVSNQFENLKVMDLDVWLEDPNNFSSRLQRVLFGHKKKKIETSLLNSYAEMLAGKTNHTEVFAYVVRKYSTPERAKNSLLGNFYFLNLDDAVNFVDTQVVYGREYFYSVSSYNLILFSEYQYLNTKVEDKTGTVTVALKPKINLVEVPFFEKSLVVSALPPIYPNVEIVKSSTTESRFFVLTPGFGEIREIPEIFRPGDLEKFVNVLKSQRDSISLDFPINFGLSGPIDHFEMFRLEQKPFQYIDFSRSELTKISPVKGAETGFIEIDQPLDQKVYYIFRSVDVFENISNPTFVFEIEIGSDGSVSVEKLELGRNLKEENYSRSFKKFLQIKPRREQIKIDMKKSDLEGLTSAKKVNLNSVSLGVKEQSSLGKKYFVLVRSKLTNRMTLFRFKFEQTVKDDS